MEFDFDALFNAYTLQQSVHSSDQCRLVHLIKSLSSFNGWKLCMSVLTGSDASMPNIHQLPPVQRTAVVFVCCRALEDFLKSAPLTPGEVGIFASFFWKWLKSIIKPYNQESFDKIVELKAGQLTCLAALRYYPKFWPSFFAEFLTFLNDLIQHDSSDTTNLKYSVKAASDFLADILINLDPHLTSRDAQLSTEEIIRGNAMKDGMRPVVIPQLTKFIYDLLRHFSSTILFADQVKKLLTAVGLLVSWIDLPLVGDENWMNLVANLIEASLKAPSGELVRSGVYTYLLGLVTKGMHPMDKINLITGMWDRYKQLLFSDPTIASLSSCPIDCSESQLECLLNFSVLLDAVGVQMIMTFRSFHSLEHNGETINGNAECSSPQLISLRSLALECIEDKLDIALFVFNHSEEQVSQAVLPFLRSYIGLLKSSCSGVSGCPQNQNRGPRRQISSLDPLGSFGTSPNGSSTSGSLGLVELIPMRLERLKRLLIILINQWRSLSMEHFTNNSETNEPNDLSEIEEEDAYRHDLKTTVCNLIQLDASFVLETIKQLVVNAALILANAAGSSAAVTEEQCGDIDVALGLFYLFAEACKAHKNDHFSSEFPLRQTMCDIMGYLCCETFSRHPRSSLQLQYFEILARYERYFFYTSDSLLSIVHAFVDSRGLHSEWRSVRIRCAYLITRVIKSHRKILVPHTEQLLNSFADLLSLPSDPDMVESGQLHDGGSKAKIHSKHQMFLGVTEQSFLYESAAQLIAVGGCAGGFVPHSPDENKMGKLFSMLLSPALAQYNQLVEKLASETNSELAVARGNLVKQAADLITRTCRVFSQPKSVLGAGCQSVLYEALNVLVNSLSRLPADAAFPGRASACAGVRAFLHRMVVCLGPSSPETLAAPGSGDDHDVSNLLLAALSQAVPQMILTAKTRHPDGCADVELRLRELRDVLPLVSQVALRYKMNCSTFLLDCLPNLLMLCLNILVEPLAPDDASQLGVLEEHKLLRRGMLQMLQTVAQHLPGLFLQLVGSLEYLTGILAQTQACIDADDAQGVRAGVGAFHHLVQTKCDDDELYRAFFLPHLVPFCVLAPSRPQFLLTDAQFNLALGDIASCLHKLAQHQEQIIVFLQDFFLPQQQLSPDLIHSYVSAVQSPSVKDFQNFIRSFYAAFR